MSQNQGQTIVSKMLDYHSWSNYESTIMNQAILVVVVVVVVYCLK